MRVERRGATRRVPDVDDTLARLRLRAGRELAVVEISDTGALVETSGRLLPGTHVEVHVVTRDGRTLVRSRVTRAWVFAVAADALRYRAALVFDTRVNTTPSRVAITHTAPREGSGAGNRYPDRENPGMTTVEGAC
jgi:ribosomal protein L30/L7E